MKFIVGLGNPGTKYKKTWHNLGFLVLDNIREKNELPIFKKNNKLQAEIAAGNIESEKVVLVKPTTYMNNSGHAVNLLLKYYKASPEDLIIIHDDIDLDLEKIKIGRDSSAGGHNGIKSIIESTKTKNFIRVRVGIRTPKSEKMDTSKYVLEKYNLFQAGKIKEIIKKAALAAEMITSNPLEEVMNKYN